VLEAAAGRQEGREAGVHNYTHMAFKQGPTHSWLSLFWSFPFQCALLLRRRRSCCLLLLLCVQVFDLLLQFVVFKFLDFLLELLLLLLLLLLYPGSEERKTLMMSL
jgi:hypothetical protein